MKPRRSQQGFTLIELLVVIAIIAMLSAVVLGAVTTGRIKAYDTRRKADLVQLRNALELYYDKHGSYPENDAWWGNGQRFIDFGTFPDHQTAANNWIPGLVSEGFISNLPQDPGYDPNACAGFGGAYMYQSNGLHYMLLSHNPSPSFISSASLTDPFLDLERDIRFNPGASCPAWMITDLAEDPTTECNSNNNGEDCTPLNSDSGSCPDHPVCW